MIVAKNLYKSFGEIQAVDNVSFCLNKGEVVTLLGANGAGKSTLMRLLCGILSSDGGNVEIFENDINIKRLAALQKIGYMPENNPIYADMNVKEFLFFIGKIHGLSHDNLIKNFEDVIEKFQLSSVVEQKIETLSKGFKGRVAVASCLIHNPKVLILDEPTEGLDPNQKYYLREIIKDYGVDNIVLISTHLIEEVEELSSRVLILSKGKLVRDTSVVELKKQRPAETLSTICRNIMNEEF